MQSRLFYLVFFLLLSTSLKAADAEFDTIVFKPSAELPIKEMFKNRRKKHPLGVNVGILGPTGWGFVSVDYFLASKINFEGGIGIQTKGINPTSLFLGAKYHLGAKFLGGITPYFGIMDAFFWKDGDFYQHNLYFPIGLHKIKRDKWTWALEMAYQYNKFASSNIWGSFKVGYRIF